MNADENKQSAVSFQQSAEGATDIKLTADR